MLPSPFDPSPTEEQLSLSLRGQPSSQVDYDWATFIAAYAQGRWDPLKTPQPPRSHISPPTHAQAARTPPRALEAPELRASPEPVIRESSNFWGTGRSTLSAHHESPPSASKTSSLTNSAPPQFHQPNSLPSTSGTQQLPTLPEGGIASRRSIPLHLGMSHRMRNSFADMRSATSSSFNSDTSRPASLANADVTTSAAAMRLAAARVSIAPLALPSPEHELTDPMRGATAIIPGSHPPDYFLPDSLLPKSPGTARKTRLSSFWQGTQDVEDNKLPTIEASPPDHPSDVVSASEAEVPPSRFPFIAHPLPPATAPVRRASEDKEDDDYFGGIDGQMFDSYSVASSDAPSASSNVTRPDHEVSRQLSAPPFDPEPSTVPALPRRICLTRQTSAPLPTLTLYERRLRSTRPVSESSEMYLASRSAKEEQMFSELGYLAPPNPPNELERRRALYR